MPKSRSIRGGLPVNGGQQANNSRLSLSHGEQGRHAPYDPLAEAPALDMQARIKLLEDTVRQLEAALVTVVMQATHGKVPKESSAHEIQLLCQRLGLRSGMAGHGLASSRPNGVLENTDHQITARMCPAFASHSECRGNACGLTCEAALL